MIIVSNSFGNSNESRKNLHNILPRDNIIQFIILIKLVYNDDWLFPIDSMNIRFVLNPYLT